MNRTLSNDRSTRARSATGQPRSRDRRRSVGAERHPTPEASRSLALALGLALTVLALEVIGGLISNSLALFADAGHVAGDAAAVALALGAIWLAGRPGGSQRTFGWYRAWRS